jgi:hypothetical protein
MSALFYRHRGQLAELAIRNRLPLAARAKEFTEAGGLITYGVDLRDTFRGAAGYVDRILKGAKPGAAGRTTDNLLSRDQSEDRQGPRPHNTALAAGARRPGDRVRHRALVYGSVAMLAAPLAGEAQQTGKVYRIRALGSGKPERFADLPAELVRRKVDVLVASNPAATIAAKNRASTEYGRSRAVMEQ